MANRPEDQPWYPKWREALERVAQIKRDSSRAGTPEREEADREYDTAMAYFARSQEKFAEHLMAISRDQPRPSCPIVSLRQPSPVSRDQTNQ
jgi:hypothetical protein